MKKIMGITYFSVDEVAELFSVARMTVQRWTKSGKLHPTKIGGRIWYSAEELENYMNK